MEALSLKFYFKDDNVISLSDEKRIKQNNIIFNSKYEVKEETRRTNLFGITLDESEVVEDYIYLANTESELQRMKSANSDAI